MVVEERDKEYLEPPVNAGDIIKLSVESFGKNGDPIMKVKGFTLFLKGVTKIKINEVLKVKVTKVCRTYGFVELVDDS